MQVAYPDRAAFHVAAEGDAVDVGVGVGDVEGACGEAHARADAGQTIRHREHAVAELLGELLAAALRTAEIAADRIGGGGRG